MLSKRNKASMLLFAISFIIFSCQPVMADIIPINEILQNDSGGFQHSFFHTADRFGGEGGTKLARILYNDSIQGGYDPITGDLFFLADVVNVNNANHVYGSVTANSTDLYASGFTGNSTGNILGIIEWEIDLFLAAGPNIFSDYISANFQETNGTYNVLIPYHDLDFSTSNQGFTANSITRDLDGKITHKTLWGKSDPALQGYDYGGHLGNDIVIEYGENAVPEPSTYVLLGLCALLYFFHRRRGEQIAESAG